MRKPQLGFLVYVRLNDGLAQSLRGLGGNSHSYQAGDYVAATIVRVWSDEWVNLKLLVDGPKDYWTTSVPKVEPMPGDGRFGWFWPDEAAV